MTENNKSVSYTHLKENIGIPSYVTFKNKDLYLPISSEYISSNINDEIKIKNLPIYYFIEGMFTAIGADENLRFKMCIRYRYNTLSWWSYYWFNRTFINYSK